MKTSKIIIYTTAAYFGAILAIVGFSWYTWQFWAISMLVIVGFLIGNYHEQRNN